MVTFHYRVQVKSPQAQYQMMTTVLKLSSHAVASGDFSSEVYSSCSPPSFWHIFAHSHGVFLVKMY